MKYDPPSPPIHTQHTHTQTNTTHRRHVMQNSLFKGDTQLGLNLINTRDDDFCFESWSEFRELLREKQCNNYTSHIAQCRWSNIYIKNTCNFITSSTPHLKSFLIKRMFSLFINYYVSRLQKQQITATQEKKIYTTFSSNAFTWIQRQNSLGICFFSMICG